MGNYGAMSKLQKTFVALSWKILEHRILYYHPELFSQKFLDKHSIPDAEYDAMEQKYIRLCKLLKKPNTAQKPIQVDLNRPAVQLALRILESKGAKSKKIRKMRKREFRSVKK